MLKPTDPLNVLTKVTSRLLPILFLLACPLPVLAAGPEIPRTEIRWDAIAGCPTESQVIALVEARLGQPLNAPREQSLRLQATVTRGANNEYELVIASEGASGLGERRISNTNCDQLADAASVVMAIAIDPTRMVPQSSESKGTGVSPPIPEEIPQAAFPMVPPPAEPAFAEPIAAELGPPVPSPPVPSPQSSGPLRRKPGNGSSSTPVPSRSNPRLHRVRLAVHALVGKGLLPVVDWGARASLGLMPWRPLEFHLGAGILVPRSVAILDSGSRMVLGAEFVDTGLCAGPAKGKSQPKACVLAELGMIHASGRDLLNQSNQRAIYASTYLEVAYAYRFGFGVGVVGAASAGLGILRPRFGVGQDGGSVEVFRPEPVLVRFSLGLFWDYP